MDFQQIFVMYSDVYAFSIRPYIPDVSLHPELLSRHVLFSIGTLIELLSGSVCAALQKNVSHSGDPWGSESQAEHMGLSENGGNVGFSQCHWHHPNF